MFNAVGGIGRRFLMRCAINARLCLGLIMHMSGADNVGWKGFSDRAQFLSQC